ncbi:MAG: hypothetical protein ACTSSE_08545 [Candidatus Thorarchaeota archaeon]
MPLEPEKYYEGLFVNPDAISAKQKMYLAKMVKSVLKESGEMSLAPQLFVANPLDRKAGLKGKFYDWGQLIARLKPDGISTGDQKIKASDTEYTLEEYETKIPITDAAKINLGMSAQDLLSAGNHARAFSRAVDSQAFNLVKDTMATTSGTDWSSETDKNVLAQLNGIIKKPRQAGFNPDAIVWTSDQRSRIDDIGMNYANMLTAEELIAKKFPGIKKTYIWDIIQAEKPDGSGYEEFFDPTGYLFVIDTKACGVFTQRPMTLENERKADAGIDIAYARKYFATALVQTKAAHQLDSLVI